MYVYPIDRKREIVMNENSSYYKEKQEENRDNYLVLKEQLPEFVTDYLDRKYNLLYSSKIAYARDILRFLFFLIDSFDEHAQKQTKDFVIKDWSALTENDMNAYISHLMESTQGNYHGNNLDSVERKLSPLRSIFRYYCNAGLIEINPISNIESLREKKKKTIVILTTDEVMELFEFFQLPLTRLESFFTPKQFSIFLKTRFRDYALFRLLLGTGIRVSECVGIDIEDINFRELSVKITRKGAHDDKVFFDEMVGEALEDYMLQERSKVKPLTGHSHAFFYSLQQKRISIDAVENIVKKYTNIQAFGKNISPHRLRASFGNALYIASGDINLVKDTLGHSSVSTTTEHYVAAADYNKLKASKVKLWSE